LPFLHTSLVAAEFRRSWVIQTLERAARHGGRKPATPDLALAAAIPAGRCLHAARLTIPQV